MNIHTIVANLYTDCRVQEFIGKQEPADLRDDLLHHCILEIYRVYEQQPGKIERLHTDNQLFAYFVGMVRKQNWSDKSTFWNRFKKGHEPDEIYLSNTDLCRVEESQPQQQQDDQACNTWGDGFIGHYYEYYHKRKERVKTVDSIQLVLW